MHPRFNKNLPMNSDATAQAETRTNFGSIAKTLGYEGDLIELDGASAATDIDIVSDVTNVALTTVDTGGANDFDLGAPAYDGQTIRIKLVSKDTQNATVTEAVGVTILSRSNAAVATITLDAEGEFVVLKAVEGTWFIQECTATVA